MSMPIAKRRPHGDKRIRAHAAPRTPAHGITPAGFVQGGSLSWRGTRCRFGTRLPDGFMSAVNTAFMSPCRISDRVRRIRLVLDRFNQSENVLPTKIRHFLERFDALDER